MPASKKSEAFAVADQVGFMTSDTNLYWQEVNCQ